LKNPAGIVALKIARESCCSIFKLSSADFKSGSFAVCALISIDLNSVRNPDAWSASFFASISLGV
jgi:hypothetical protein